MLHFLSPVLEPSGYGIAGRDYIMSFYEEGHRVTFTPTFFYSNFNPDFINKSDLEVLMQLRKNSLLEVDRNIPLIFHNTPVGSKVSSYMKETILYTTWETNRLPYGTEKLLDQFNLVLTPSEFSKTCFLNSGTRARVEIIPHVIRKKAITEDQLFIGKFQSPVFSKGFVFLSIFDFHLGKGYDTLLKSFYSTFSEKDDVVLIVKTSDFSKYSGDSDIRKIILSYKENSTARVVLITSMLRDDEIMYLHSISDCYVSPTRREAWGLNFGEALSFGKTVIAPSLGGHRQFLNDKNALLIDSKPSIIKDTEPSRTDYKGQVWIDSSVEHLSVLMRRVYDAGKVCVDRNRYSETLDEFSTKKIVNLFKRTIGV